MRERKNEKTTGADEEGAVVLTGLAPVVGEAPLIPELPADLTLNGYAA